MYKQTLKLYWRAIKQHSTSFWIMLLCIPLAAVVIDSLLPYFLSRAIGEIGKATPNYNVWLAASVAAGIVGVVLNYVGFKAMVHHESKVPSILRLSTLRGLLSKSHDFFINQKVGAMTSRYIDFVRAQVSLQDLLIIRTLGFVLTVFSGVYILGRESLTLAALVLAFLVALIVQIRITTRIRAPWRRERKQLVADIHGQVSDVLTNNLTVRTFAGEKKEIQYLSELTTRFGDVYKKDIGFFMTEGSVRVGLMIAIQIGSVFLAAQLLISGKLETATAIFILAYMQRLGSQLFQLGDMINGYDQALLDAQPMTEMLVSGQVSPAHGQAIDDTSYDIEFREVVFSYPDTKAKALDGVSFRVSQGEKVGLVGHSGAGKSTIVQLIERFYDPSSGTISIGSQDITQIAPTSLREHISYVPQEPLLFHRSLKENIAYGKDGSSEKEVLDAAKQAHATEFINSLPQGLETVVGERGVKLSGGQRQRVAIARAMLKNAPILILDEATSALDSESEKLIQESFETLMQGRTSIVVAHRLSTIAKLDRILVLDEGKIAEQGTHSELLRQKGIYYRLWSHQSGGFIKE